MSKFSNFYSVIFDGDTPKRGFKVSLAEFCSIIFDKLGSIDVLFANQGFAGFGNIVNNF